MQNNTTRIIVDTNLWISFLITNNFEKFDALFLGGKTILIFSEELLQEFLEVAKRPKFRKFFSHSDLEDVVEIISQYADFVVVKTSVNICRDIKDNFLLSLAKDGEADFLLTGDKDLLDLKVFEKTVIITISDFLNNLQIKI